MVVIIIIVNNYSYVVFRMLYLDEVIGCDLRGNFEAEICYFFFRVGSRFREMK